MSGLFKKVDLLAEVDSRGDTLASELLKQFNTFHSNDYREDIEIETLLLKQRELEVGSMAVKGDRPNLFIFSPSGASKCSKELYFKLIGADKKEVKYPYQRRWTRNATAVHEAVQRDLLYSEKFLRNAPYKVKRMENGLPAWEGNLKTFKIIEHNGVNFAVLGMMDGVLIYKDGSTIGFEFKTKSNSIGQVGNYKMKDATEAHKQQCVAYSILFGMDEFLLMYESVAKDQWNKGPEAKMDIRTFYHKVTEEERQALLDKFAAIAKSAQENAAPAAQLEKCLFCPYKHICEDYNEGDK